MSPPAPRAGSVVSRGPATESTSPLARWLARGLGSPVVIPAVLLLLVALALGWLGQATEGIDLLLLLLPWAGVAMACLALAWVRPQRHGASPPHVMLALGFVGMLMGLLFDVAQAGAAQLGAVCAQAGSLDLWQALRLHLRFLPGMHAGMLAGGLLAIPVLRGLRPRCNRYLCSLFTQNLLCSAWMVVGMTWGGLWLSRWPMPLSAPLSAPLGASTLPGMLGGMFVGMAWGMVLSVLLYRSYFAWRHPPRAQAAQPTSAT